jgi:hypothetical protein
MPFASLQLGADLLMKRSTGRVIEPIRIDQTSFLPDSSTASAARILGAVKQYDALKIRIPDMNILMLAVGTR